MEDLKDGSKRRRDEEEETASPEAKRMREEDVLDYSDEETAAEIRCYMKSFESEIVDPATESDEIGESGPDLCYLLEATDDELGLPPTAGSSPAVRDGIQVPVWSEAEAEIRGEFWEVPGYEDDEFGYGFGIGVGFGEVDGEDSEYVALDGLFDYSDICFGPSGSFCRYEEPTARLEFEA